MRSAYLTLGVPGDATPEQIEAAFRDAERLFTRERLASEDGALERLGELREAYMVLRDPEARAAHDRNLAAGPPAAQHSGKLVVGEERSLPMQLTIIVMWLLVAALAAGFYLQ